MKIILFLWALVYRMYQFMNSEEKLPTLAEEIKTNKNY